MRRTVAMFVAVIAVAAASPSHGQNYAERYNQANRLPLHTPPHLNGSADSYPGGPRRYVFRQGRLTPIAGMEELFPARTGVRGSGYGSRFSGYGPARTVFNRAPSFASNNLQTAPGGYTVTRFR